MALLPWLDKLNSARRKGRGVAAAVAGGLEQPSVFLHALPHFTAVTGSLLVSHSTEHALTSHTLIQGQRHDNSRHESCVGRSGSIIPTRCGATTSTALDSHTILPRRPFCVSPHAGHSVYPLRKSFAHPAQHDTSRLKQAWLRFEHNTVIDHTASLLLLHILLRSSKTCCAVNLRAHPDNAGRVTRLTLRYTRISPFPIATSPRREFEGRSGKQGTRVGRH